MPLIAPEVGDSYSGAVKRVANNTKKLRVARPKKDKAAKAAGGAPEVMAKVTGFSKGKSHCKSHLDYIARNGDLEIETDRGEIVKGRTAIKAFASDWTQEFSDKKTYKNQRDTAHIVLSMPPGTDPEAVRNATRNFAKKTFGANHEYVFALHTDTKSPHCHLTVKCLGFDGKRLNPRKADLQRYREGFAQAMEEQGYMANATPRKVRGVVKKPERQVIRHIEERGTPKVKALKIKETAEELAAGKELSEKPWIAKIKQGQEKIRRAWLAAADALNNQSVNREYRNDRPNYAGVDHGRVREQQRVAGIHQSRNSAPGGRGSTDTLASVRNLSGLGMVQNQRPSEMLLLQDARRSLGHADGRTPGDALRRAGASAAGLERSSGRLTPEKEPKALAARIKGFVEGMPPVETERDQLRRELAGKFAKPRTIEQSQDGKSPKGGPTQEPAKDVPKAPAQSDQDLER